MARLSLPELCLQRPVATTTGVVAALVFGLVAFTRLPLEYLPEIQGSSLTVEARYASSPDEVERSVVTPIEDACASLESLESMTSQATSSGASVRLEFMAGADTDAAALDLRERLDRIRPDLPQELEQIEVRRWRSSDLPIIRMRVAPQRHVDGATFASYIDDVLAPNLARLPGIGQVEVRGLARPRVLVELDPELLSQVNLTPAQVSNLLQRRNRNASAGLLRASERVLAVRVLGELGDAQAVRDLPLTAGLFLRDVARVVEELPPLEEIERLDGRPAVTLRVARESGANTIATCDLVRAEVERLANLPESRDYRLDIYSDVSERIRERIHNLQASGVYGGLLLVIVLLVALRRLATTFVVAVTIPLSIVLTFAAIYVLRQLGAPTTLNIVSIMGLILGIGLVVDNGIVVVENIVRLRELGVPPRRAAAQGAREVSGAITASVITSLIVFVPLLFTDARSGRWMRDLAIVVCAAVASSLVVALTVVPSLAAWALRDRRPTSDTPEPDLDRPLAPQRGLYTTTVRKSLKVRYLIGLFVAVVFGHQIFTFFRDTEPSWGRGEDSREFDVDVDIPRSFDANDRIALFDQLEAVILAHRDDLDLKSLTSSFRTTAEGPLRRGWGGSGNELELLLNEDGPGERLSVDEARRRVKELLPVIPGVALRVGGGRNSRGGSDQEIVFLVEGRDSEVLRQPSLRVADVLRTLPEVDEVQLGDTLDASGIEVHPRPTQTARLGLPARDLGNSLSAAFDERTVTRLRSPRRELDVVLRVDPEHQTGLAELLRTPITPPDLPAVPLEALADVRPGPAPREIRRVDRRAVAEVTAVLHGDANTREAARHAQDTLARLDLPRGVTVRLEQRLRRWQQQEGESIQAWVLAFVLVLIVLCALLENYTQPLVIVLTVPFALSGVAWAFQLTDTKLDDIAWVGLMILTGIVVNHGIVLVDRFNLLLAKAPTGPDAPPRHELLDRAITQAGRERLRPIVMTATTTILGLVPILGQLLFPETFSADSGAQVYGPIGLAVASGLVTATVLTLLILPSTLRIALDIQSLIRRVLGLPPFVPNVHT